MPEDPNRSHSHHHRHSRGPGGSGDKARGSDSTRSTASTSDAAAASAAVQVGSGTSGTKSSDKTTSERHPRFSDVVTERSDLESGEPAVPPRISVFVSEQTRERILDNAYKDFTRVPEVRTLPEAAYKERRSFEKQAKLKTGDFYAYAKLLYKVAVVREGPENKKKEVLVGKKECIFDGNCSHVGEFRDKLPRIESRHSKSARKAALNMDDAAQQELLYKMLKVLSEHFYKYHNSNPDRVQLEWIYIVYGKLRDVIEECSRLRGAPVMSGLEQQEVARVSEKQRDTYKRIFMLEQ